MTALEQIISAEIAAHGPMRFDRWMELALYHPTHGYYSRLGQRPLTGKDGDFFTSVSVGPLFGRLLAAQIFQMWENLGRPDPFWIVEQGAHDGQLGRDLLTWCREVQPAFFAVLHYGIVEPSAVARAIQLQLLSSFGRVTHLQDLRDRQGPNPATVFLSNELVDAFPVRVVRWDGQAWLERYVVLDTGQGQETYAPITDPELLQAVRPLPALQRYTTEINLRARAWMNEIAQTLDRGYVITLDYGFPASLYYAPFRQAGTLTAYRAHRQAKNILSDPGEQDITAHVDFTALVDAGRSGGLESLGLVDQQHFLMGIAAPELEGDTSLRLGVAESLRAWNTLTHPQFLGARFHALIQGKNAPAKLAGLTFARPNAWE